MPLSRNLVRLLGNKASLCSNLSSAYTVILAQPLPGSLYTAPQHDTRVCTAADRWRVGQGSNPVAHRRNPQAPPVPDLVAQGCGRGRLKRSVRTRRVSRSWEDWLGSLNRELLLRCRCIRTRAHWFTTDLCGGRLRGATETASSPSSNLRHTHLAGLWYDYHYCLWRAGAVVG